MGKYFILQIKRFLRLLVPALLVIALLFGGMTVIYDVGLKWFNDSDQHMRAKIGLVGVVGDTYLELGLAAMESFDSSRLSMELVPMEEAEAVSAMHKGNLAAYIIFPEGFMEEAMMGKIMPLKYVTTSGAVGMVSLVKDEITGVVNQIMIESQKGIYGAGNAMNEAGFSSGKVVNDISLEYVDFVMHRSKVYSVKELGEAYAFHTEEQLLCGLSVLFLMLACLPFAPVLVRRDPALGRMLAAQRRPATAQALCEFGAYLLSLLVVLVILLVSLGILGMSGQIRLSLKVVLHAVPVILSVASLSFLLYELTDDLISGVLLQFFAILVHGYISGCMYPINFFPEIVQKMAKVMPAGIAVDQLVGCLTGMPSGTGAFVLLGYSLLFLTVALAIRKHKITGVRG